MNVVNLPELSKNMHKLAAWFRLYRGMEQEARENCATACENAAKELDAFRTSNKSFSYKECEIEEHEDGVHLWYVVGMLGKWYPTKIVAEQAARVTFPDDPNPYGRIYYCTFLGEE